MNSPARQLHHRSIRGTPGVS